MKNVKNTIGFLALVLILAGGILAVVGTGGCSKKEGAAQAQPKKMIYTCSMHHQIRRDQPGDCPICGMTLVPLEQIEGTPSSGQVPEKKVKYWANPMHPEQHSNKPMKDEMGMDYVPVYEEGTSVPVATSPDQSSGSPREIQGLAPVHISSYKEQLIDVKLATVQKASIVRSIHTTGRFGGGTGDFAVMAGDFAARQTVRSSGRYLVADIYALDIPFVQEGQKAWISTLSGSGAPVEGKVSYLYPYDQTQSRVTRVKISLSQAMPRELFANVSIQSVLPSRLAVPSTAVLDTGAQRYVFIQTAPGTYTPRAVTTGFEGDDLWEVTGGLKEGEKVVDGATFLIDADSKLKAAFSEKE